MKKFQITEKEQNVDKILFDMTANCQLYLVLQNSASVNNRQERNFLIFVTPSY